MKTSLCLEQVEEAAAAWLLKREHPQWSPADETALAEWLNASANHRVAYMRLRSVWREAGRLKIVGAGFPPGQVPPRGVIGESPFFAGKRRASLESISSPSPQPEASTTTRLSGGAFKLYGFAASLLLVASLGAAAYFWPTGAPSYRTPVGGLATVPMGDGSKITLNTNSEMTIEETANERRVNLTRGEAFFDVAEDPKRPFVVYASEQRVIAVGTRFAVRLEPEAIRVVVTEGRVRLEKLSSRRDVPLLTPGTIANASNEEVSIQQRPLADIEQSLSWRTGHVVLRKAFLRDAVAEFNRYNQRQLIIDDPALDNIQVGGNFRSKNIDGFVRLLQEGFQIEATARGDHIVLTQASRAE